MLAGEETFSGVGDAIITALPISIYQDKTKEKEKKKKTVILTSCRTYVLLVHR